MMRHRPTRMDTVRTARRRKAIRQTLRPAIVPAPPQPDDEVPASPVATEDFEPFDAEDLRALKSGWTFVE